MRAAITYLCTAMLVFAPLRVSADNNPAPITPNQTDDLALKNVELSPSGELTGQYLTATGLPLAGKSIIVTQAKQKQQVITDENGRFVIRTLNGGTAVIHAGERVFACRVWAHGTAPGNALRNIAVVDDDGTAVRGNPYHKTKAYLYGLSTKQRIALGVLLATGITIAIVESDDDGS